MKTPEQIIAEVARRLGRTWHLDAAEQHRACQENWPHSFPLGTAAKAELEADFGGIQGATFAWHDWATAHGIALADTFRMVHGTTQRIPTHATIATVDAAAELCGNEWTDRLARGRARAATLRSSFPDADVAQLVRDVDSYTEVDFDLLCVTAEWFRTHSTVGLTPRQVPIPGLHAKWLNARHSIVASLAGLSNLDLLPRHPARLHFTYLDPHHRAAGGRWQDSATIGDTVAIAYAPSVVVISENKDTAIHFPVLAGGISVEGAGHGGTTAASFSWIRECPNLFYWGDLDAPGFEILDGFRRAGLAVTSILMDMATYERYEEFGTATDARGNTLISTARRALLCLTDAERHVYECLTHPAWSRYRRIEQERIPLGVAATAVRAHLPEDREQSPPVNARSPEVLREH